MTDVALPIVSGNRSLATSQLLALWVDAIVISGVVFLGRLLQPRVEIAQTFVMVAIGYSLGIATVSGLWMSLGPLSGARRIIVAPLISLSAFVLPMIALSLSGASVEAVTMAAVVLPLAIAVQFLVIQAPYWLSHSWWDFKIVHTIEMKATNRVGELQFTIWQLLIVLTMAAVGLGISRWAVDLAVLVRPQNDAGLELAANFGLLLGFNALVAWALAWAAVSRSATAWKLGGAFGFIAILLVSVNSTLPAMARTSLWLLFAPQPVYLLTHLIATRLSGYRLITASTRMG